MKTEYSINPTCNRASDTLHHKIYIYCASFYIGEHDRSPIVGLIRP